MSVKIISGKFKRISIDVPQSARATLTRARQSLFDMLESSLQKYGDDAGEFFKDKIVLDCFAGSGAIGIEALSRGAKYAYLVDIDKNAALTIKNNIKKVQAEENATVLCCNILKIKKNNAFKSCNFVFIDPPFNANINALDVINALKNNGWIDKNCIAVMEFSEDSCRSHLKNAYNNNSYNNIIEKLNHSEQINVIAFKKVGTIVFCICKISIN